MLTQPGGVLAYNTYEISRIYHVYVFIWNVIVLYVLYMIGSDQSKIAYKRAMLCSKICTFLIINVSKNFLLSLLKFKWENEHFISKLEDENFISTLCCKVVFAIIAFKNGYQKNLLKYLVFHCKVRTDSYPQWQS